MKFKKLLALTLVLALVLSTMNLAVFAEGEVTPLSSFTFTQDDALKTVTLTKYNNGSGTTVVVPGTYNIDGTDYTVIINSLTTFKGNTSITSVTLGAGVKFKNNTMKDLFNECTKLATVDLTKISTTGITDMSYLFTKCSSLTDLDVTNFDTSSVTTMRGMFANIFNLNLIGYQDWDTSSLKNIRTMFNEVVAMEVIDLSKWDMSNVVSAYYTFQACKAKKFVLPDSLNIIGSGMFNHTICYEGDSFTIPANIKEIGYSHIFYDMGTSDFVKFEVEEGNTSFVAIDGVLYSADKTELISVPRGKTFPDDTYYIEEGVTFIPELCFSRNMNLKKVVFPDSYVMRQFVSLSDPQYVHSEDPEDRGNINQANSLTLAFYLCTGVEEYAVKDTNPTYSSDNGIIYSKDMTKLMAIPARYAKRIEIPEGVTTWDPYSICTTWDAVKPYMAYCSGVDIPSTMSNIATDQFNVINEYVGYTNQGKISDLIYAFEDRVDITYRKPVKWNFKVSVDDDNPYYSTDANGKLVKFGAALSEKFYVYDGTAKTPDVTVGSAGTILAEGTDYTVEYIGNENPGTAKVKITGIGTYAGKEITKTFTIATDATIANTLKIDFVETTPVGAEGYITADIVVSAPNDIQELNTADLTFKLDVETEGAEIDYEISATNPAIEINNVEGDRYEFHYKEGNENVENNIVIGQVKLSGYGKFDFYVAEADTNIVTATTVKNNIVTYFVPGGDISATPETEGELDLNDVDNRDVTDTDGDKPDDLSDKVIAIATRNLEIVVTFPNVVNFNEAAYQNMKVKVTGGLAKVPELKLGDAVIKDTVVYGAETSECAVTPGTAKVSLENKEGVLTDVDVNAYTITLKLPVNTNYTIEVTGDGYRTARYNVVLSDNKTVKFWNNVMDAERVMEVGRDSSKVHHNFLAGDIVEDNDINIYDLSAVVSYFAKSIADPAEYDAYVKYDLNRDGVIDSKDVAYVLVSWGN